jgi:hypothetical protein
MRKLCGCLIWIALLTEPAAAELPITVTLYDEFVLQLAGREAMKAEVTRILNQAGLTLNWVECMIGDNPANIAACTQPLGPTRLMLQLVPGNNRRRPMAAGMAIIAADSAVYACVYPARIKELARETNWEFSDLLAHAAAHELGHLLLRSSRHSSAGVMRASWEVTDLRQLSHAGLVFLPGQLSATAVVRLRVNADNGHR